MTTLYIEPEKIEEFALFEEEMPHWNKIIKSGIDICINISDEELDTKISDEYDPLYIAYNSSATMELPVALDEYIQQVKGDLEQIIDKPRSIFVLDIDEQEANKLQEDLGAAIYSVNNIPDKILDFSYYVDLEKNEKFQSNWKDIITFNKALSNSLVITDNYYFSNEDNGINRGFSNLINFLDAYLPDTLDVEYQIAIFANDYSKPESWWIKEYGKLVTEIRRLRTYSIHLELVLTETIHRRRLISNYVFGKTDQGYDLFHARDIDTIKQDNDFEHSEVFSNLNNLGTKHFQSASITLDKLEQKCQEVIEYVKVSGNTAQRMLFGCNKDKTIKNRLLN